jgi:hypothetical protein
MSEEDEGVCNQKKKDRVELQAKQKVELIEIFKKANSGIRIKFSAEQLEQLSEIFVDEWMDLQTLEDTFTDKNGCGVFDVVDAINAVIQLYSVPAKQKRKRSTTLPFEKFTTKMMNNVVLEIASKCTKDTGSDLPGDMRGIFQKAKPEYVPDDEFELWYQQFEKSKMNLETLQDTLTDPNGRGFDDVKCAFIQHIKDCSVTSTKFTWMTLSNVALAIAKTCKKDTESETDDSHVKERAHPVA